MELEQFEKASHPPSGGWAYTIFHLHMSPVTLISIITKWSLFTATFPSIAPVASAGRAKGFSFASSLFQPCLWASQNLSGCTHAECQHSERLTLYFLSTSFQFLRNLEKNTYFIMCAKCENRFFFKM